MAPSLRASALVALGLLLAACASRESRPYRPPAVPGEAPSPASQQTSPKPAPAQRCAPGDGAVVRIVDRGGAKAASQALQGGVLAGVLSDGKPPATKSAVGFDIYVQMDDGRKVIVNQRDVDGIAVGARVGVDAGCRAHPTH
ncbi:MAG: hypothetical protein JSS44_10510 [Proteobacteria bacterium]|nr:hypothetical protein [Pseudomonadota bacterium]